MRVSILFQAGESRLQLTETATARDHFAAAAGLIGTPQPKTANAPTEPAKTRGKKGAKPDPRSANIAGTPPELAESILMRLGETQSLTGEHKAAQETYKKFLSSFPESRWTRNAQFGLGFALEMGGNPKAAIPEYAKLLTADVVDLWTVRARFQTGECHFNQQEYDKAVTEFVNMEINFSKYPDWQAKAALEIGRVLLAQGKREEAEQRLKDVIRKFSKEKAAIIARQLLDKMRDS
jgi:TolA-binding protein